MLSEPISIAKYMRLSVEDALEGESNSITNQRLLIDSYLRQMQFDTYSSIEFIDDGLSGVNFDRPAFQNMMQEIRKSKINIVVIKDFSRLGRDYIEAGNLIEQVFPFLGVRLISINDQYDSEKAEGQAGDVNIALKNLANYFYSRDLSQKIKSATQTLMQQGNYIVSDTIYGYMKDPHQRGKLLVDPEAAVVIKRIYQLFLNGVSLCQIAVVLNAEGVLTPAQYKAKRTGKMSAVWDVRQGKPQYWTNDKVRIILKDERYTGAYIVGKRKAKAIGSNKMVPLPQEQWIRIENRNEAIISKEDFEKVQKILLSRRQFTKGKRHLLTGKLLCGVCHKSMLRAGYNKKTPYVYCETPRFLPTAECSTDRVSVVKIETVVRNAINVLFGSCLGNNALQKITERIDVQIKECESQNRKGKKQMQRLKAKARMLYERWKEDMISEETFLKQKSSIAQNMHSIVNKSGSLQKRIEELELQKRESQNLLSNVDKYNQVAQLTEELIQTFVTKILIYDKQHMEVIWNFELHPSRRD